jgi:hypothetical protein
MPGPWPPADPAAFATAVLRLVGSAAPPPVRLPIGADAWPLILEAAERDRAALLELACQSGVPLPHPNGDQQTRGVHGLRFGS